MSLRLGVARSRRRKATRFAMLAAACGVLISAPAAVALDQVVEAAPAEAVVAVDAETVVTQPAEPVADAPPPPPPVAPTEPEVEPAPEAPAAVAPPPAPPAAPDPPPVAPVDPVVAPIEPPPAPAAASSEPPPPPPSAPHEATIRTPPAPQEEPAPRRDDEPAGAGAVTLSVAAPDDPIAATQRTDATGLGTKLTTPVLVSGTKTSPEKPSAATAPLVAPIVQRLLPVAEPFFAGPHSQLPSGAVTAAALPAAPVDATPRGGAAKASHVQSNLVFGGFVPVGDLSDQSAGLLAMLMGLLPLGLPDGKFSMNAETQLGLLLLGVLLAVVPWFANPIRDRRRRGPRGFATLALRPG